MTAEEVIDLAREEVTELQSTGRFDNDEMLNILNKALKVVIKNLWDIAKFDFLYSLRVTDSLDLSESSEDSDWVEGDLSDIEDFLPIYRPSLNLWISDNGKWIRVKQTNALTGRVVKYYDTYPTKTIKAEVKGNIVILYSSDYDSIDVEAISSPTYDSGDIVALDDLEIEDFLVTRMCMIIKKRDLGIVMERDYERDYTINLNNLRRAMLGKKSPLERVPPYYRHHGYPSKGTIYNG